jgi:hypothetical protein
MDDACVFFARHAAALDETIAAEQQRIVAAKAVIADAEQRRSAHDAVRHHIGCLYTCYEPGGFLRRASWARLFVQGYSANGRSLLAVSPLLIPGIVAPRSWRGVLHPVMHGRTDDLVRADEIIGLLMATYPNAGITLGRLADAAREPCVGCGEPAFLTMTHQSASDDSDSSDFLCKTVSVERVCLFCLRIDDVASHRQDRPYRSTSERDWKRLREEALRIPILAMWTPAPTSTT